MSLAKDGLLAMISTQSSTGRFDGKSPSLDLLIGQVQLLINSDAPESIQTRAGGSRLPNNTMTTTNNGKSPTRTAQHMRVLDMVRTAQAHSAVIASMNHTDLGEFSEMIDSLKANVDQVWRRRMSEMRQGQKK